MKCITSTDGRGKAPRHFTPAVRVVDLVSRHVDLLPVDADADVKMPFRPLARVKVSVDLLRDLRAAAAADDDRAFPETEFPQAAGDIVPLLGEIAR